MKTLIQSKPHIEVADILRMHIADYLTKYNMPREHYKIVHDILTCRTAYLGGHMEKCDHCGAERPAYNSCRNRHCPKCQTMTKERWLEARKNELLPVIYFHNVFTVPHEINPVILCNKQVMLAILFKSVSETLLQFGSNPKNGLGGKLGFIAILHTWDQKLNDHFHLHCLVPGGALSPDKDKWISCRNDFLFPDSALSRVFRGKFIDYLEQAFEEEELIFPGNTASLGTSNGFKSCINQLWSKNWVVKIKEPIKRPELVLEYLGRYTHRVAISNDRILSLHHGKVTFAYKNRDTGKRENVSLDAIEFIRRFLLHVLPKGFVRIRHYGFLANRCKKENIKKCRKLLGLSSELPERVEKSVEEIMFHLTGVDIKRCPFCKRGTMRVIAEIPKQTDHSAFNIIHASEFFDTG